MGVIFALSSLPASRVPGRVGSWAHFAEYATLAVLLVIPLGARRAALAAALLAFAISSAYGVTDELHQTFVAGRDPSVGDWAIDTLGAAVGVAAWILARRAARGRPS